MLADINFCLWIIKQIEFTEKYIIFEKCHSERSEESCISKALRLPAKAHNNNNVTFFQLLRANNFETNREFTINNYIYVQEEKIYVNINK